MALSDTFQAHRPPNFTGRGDAHLPGIIKDLRRFLAEIQNEFTYDTLRLPAQELPELAYVLVEFGEDIHANIGIWTALEQYNRDLFGTPLPLTLRSEAITNKPPELVDRLHHLLWVIYHEIEPELTLAPQHQDLQLLAQAVATFLDDRLAAVPRQSGIKQFLAQPNRFGWDVKQKLVWLGYHAYLFRYPCQNYIADNGGRVDIGIIDDFICQETTRWSGLGVIDILAGLLPLSTAQRKNLRGWYERHMAFYEMLSLKSVTLHVINLINNQPYKIRVDKDINYFKPGHIIFGSLVPWEGRWYWSGEQKAYPAFPEATKQQVVDDMLRRMPNVVYRYDVNRLNHAKETLSRLSANFVSYHGDNLAVYADGSTMNADMQRMYTLSNEAMLEAERTKTKQKVTAISTQPQLSHPPELVASQDGVAVFFNPDEGPEIFNHFDILVSALQKQGEGLSEDETLAVQGLIESDSLSPHFVRRLLQDYSDASIAAAYLIDQPPDYYLDYLLRRYKGHFYRRRYPHLTVVG
ncbi:MAG: DUF3843 family protein [Anaerolineae bacterium]|nr:DUF3843 family protein [Anaerolineae bacterium]